MRNFSNCHFIIRLICSVFIFAFLVSCGGADNNNSTQINDEINFSNEGDKYFNSQLYSRAVEEYTKDLFLNPQNDYSYNMRGNCWMHMGEYDKAATDHTRAIKIFPQKALYYKNRGLDYFYLENYEKSISDYKTSIGISPDDPDLYSKLAYSYIGAGNITEALNTAEYLLNISYTAVFLNTRGDVYRAMEESELMCQDYSDACDLDLDISCLKLDNLCN